MAEILRNLWRRKLRTALTITGIFMGIVALTTMGAMAEHFNSLIDGGVRYYGGSIQVTSANAGGLFTGGGILPVAQRERLAAVEGVAAVFPNVTVLARPGDTGAVSFGPPDFIAASDPEENRFSALRLEVADGRDITTASRGEVVLGSDFAEEFDKGPGDTITLPVPPDDARPGFVSHDYQVVGILEQTRTAPDNGAYVSLHDAQTLLGESLPPAIRRAIDPYVMAHGMVVYGQPGEDLDALARTINDRFPGLEATEPSELVDAFRSGGAVFTAITTVAALLALVIGGLSVVNTMLMSVTERVREIGLKKAVGARTRHVLVEFLTESTMIGLIGGILGYGVGVLVTVMLNGAAGVDGLFQVTPRLTVLSIGFAIVLGAVAGLLPARRAARMDPVLALRAVG